jgi:hypothetical protein
MRIESNIKDWLLEGDPSIVYQTQRDLLCTPAGKLCRVQESIALKGWGRQFLERQNPAGHWGRGPYQPKWTCTHYTLIDLKNLGIAPDCVQCRKATQQLLGMRWGKDGGINYARTVEYSDICINGMILDMAAYFTPEAEGLPHIIDYILSHQFKDGGWNCQYYEGATHSSVHSTMGILEGLSQYQNSRSTYREREVAKALSEGIEFLLRHRLFRSEKTGAPIDPKMLMLSYPYRWKYDVLRALDLIANQKSAYDERMADGIEVLLKKRRRDGRWPLQLKHPGQTHFEMEKVGEPSRWNTLRALKVLRHFRIE